MNIEITGIAEDVINDIISSGDAATPEEAIMLMASRTMREKELLPARGDSRIAEAVQEGFASGEAGEISNQDWTDLHAKLDQYLAEKQEQRSAG